MNTSEQSGDNDTGEGGLPAFFACDAPKKSVSSLFTCPYFFRCDFANETVCVWPSTKRQAHSGACLVSLGPCRRKTKQPKVSRVEATARVSTTSAGTSASMVEAEQAATDSGNGTGVRALFGVARSHLIYWQRKPSAWLVVVPVFLYVFASSLSVSPLSQFIIVRVCRALGPELGSIPTGAEEKYMHFLADPEYSQCVVRADVQAAAALLSQLLGIAFDTPALLLVPVMGSLVDTRGRRSMLACPVLAALLFALAIAAVHQFELTLWTLVPARLFCGCLGGFPLLTLAANAFVADTTPPDRRTHAFLLIDTTVFVGFSLGPLCGGLLYRTAGILPVVALVVVSCLSVLLYLAFVLPETVSSASLLLHSRSQPISTSSPIRYIGITFVRSWTKAFDVLATPEHASSLVVLAITAACNNIGSAGYQFAFYFYPSQRFAWDAYDFGLYSMAKSFCRMFYLSVLMPFLLRTFVTGRERIQKTRAEITIIRTGYLMYAIGLVLHAFAQEGHQFYPLLLVYTLGTISSPPTRAIASRAVPSHAQGQLFAALELLQGGTALLSQFYVPSIYRLLVKSGKPQALFYLLAGCWMVSFVIAGWLRPLELAEMDRGRDEGAVSSEGDEEREPLMPASAMSGPESENEVLESEDCASDQEVSDDVMGNNGYRELEFLGGGSTVTWRGTEDGAAVPGDGNNFEIWIEAWLERLVAGGGLEAVVEESRRERLFI